MKIEVHNHNNTKSVHFDLIDMNSSKGDFKKYVRDIVMELERLEMSNPDYRNYNIQKIEAMIIEAFEKYNEGKSK